MLDESEKPPFPKVTRPRFFTCLRAENGCCFWQVSFLCQKGGRRDGLEERQDRDRLVDQRNSVPGWTATSPKVNRKTNQREKDPEPASQQSAVEILSQTHHCARNFAAVLAALSPQSRCCYSMRIARPSGWPEIVASFSDFSFGCCQAGAELRTLVSAAIGYLGGWLCDAYGVVHGLHARCRVGWLVG